MLDLEKELREEINPSIELRRALGWIATRRICFGMDPASQHNKGWKGIRKISSATSASQLSLVFPEYRRRVLLHSKQQEKYASEHGCKSAKVLSRQQCRKPWMIVYDHPLPWSYPGLAQDYIHIYGNVLICLLYFLSQTGGLKISNETKPSRQCLRVSLFTLFRKPDQRVKMALYVVSSDFEDLLNGSRLETNRKVYTGASGYFQLLAGNCNNKAPQ